MRLKLPIHGRNHRKTGSDPIPDDIAFNWDNQGGALRVETHDRNPDGTDLELKASGGGDLYLQNYGGGDITLDSHQSVNVNGLTDVAVHSFADATLTADQALFLTSEESGTTSATVMV